MCLVTDPELVSPDTIVIETIDGKYQIDIGACELENEPFEEVTTFFAHGEYKQTSAILAVDRGEMKGYGVFYHDNDWSFEYYEERLGYPMNVEGQNGFILVIQHEVDSELHRNQLEAFINKANIKILLDSIRYEPTVCNRITDEN